MRTGRPTRLTVRLTDDERQTVPVRRARRGRLLLLLEAGLPITRIAATVGISRRFVYKWARRFQAQGLQGLYDRPRPGRRKAADEGEEDTPCPGTVP